MIIFIKSIDILCALCKSTRINTTNQRAVKLDSATTQVVDELKKYNPSRKFAIEENGGSLGVWDKLENRYFPIAMRTITNEWVMTQKDVLVNGESILRNWLEV